MIYKYDLQIQKTIKNFDVKLFWSVFSCPKSGFTTDKYRENIFIEHLI